MTIRELAEYKLNNYNGNIKLQYLYPEGLRHYFGISKEDFEKELLEFRLTVTKRPESGTPFIPVSEVREWFYGGGYKICSVFKNCSDWEGGKENARMDRS